MNSSKSLEKCTLFDSTEGLWVQSGPERIADAPSHSCNIFQACNLIRHTTAGNIKFCLVGTALPQRSRFYSAYLDISNSEQHHTLPILRSPVISVTTLVVRWDVTTDQILLSISTVDLFVIFESSKKNYPIHRFIYL
ncbi:hypothetical protein Y032_0470g2033 [Ancylostoma ceylanicum]|uniref:Uncharacterized protein n=1 Tax=Ancylostoma ceylanicum TaxID=53326 RepID=A0A016WWX5_9BILA|nr:hypothetical protein Y032_0470g2033 [Ancylostoma ceylanicum]